MECRDVRSLAQAYVDNEVDAVAAARIASHLSSCSACASAVDQLRALRTAIDRHGTRHLAPPQLQQRIRASLDAGKPERRALRSWPWARINFGLAAASGAAFAVTLALLLAQPSGADRLDEEIVASHFRSLMADHLADVASSDQHTVKPWFGGKLDFSPPVVDLGAQGFPLLGGRLDYVQGRPVAALAYQHRKHLLNLYVWPAAGARDLAVRATSQRGFQLAEWTQRGMRFVAVSDMSAQDLAAFARMAGDELARGGAGEWGQSPPPG